MTLFLAVILAFSMAVTASAASGSMVAVVGGSNDIGDVVVTVSEGDTPDVYYVIIEWDSLNFSYAKSKSTWDAENHTYKTENAAWGPNGNTADITVTNKSNVKINVTAAANDQSGSDGFSVALSKSNFDLVSYVDRDIDDPATDTTTLTVSANSPSQTSTVAEIIISIAKKA